jgi:hypothetical protein
LHIYLLVSMIIKHMIVCQAFALNESFREAACTIILSSDKKRVVLVLSKFYHVEIVNLLYNFCFVLNTHCIKCSMSDRNPQSCIRWRGLCTSKGCWLGQGWIGMVVLLCRAHDPCYYL